MSKGELQLRNACDISPGMTISYSDPGFITVSRNTISFSALTTMSVPQLNMLITIIKTLQREMVFGAKFPFQYTGEVEIPISLQDVSGCHSYEDVKPAILSLMDLKLIYSHEFDGMVAGVTTMISAVEYRNGRFFVAVSGRALPWYLFCGTKVGFARIEPHVFSKLSSVREKILYLRLMSFVDNKTQIAEKRVSVQELREWLNYGNNEPIGRVKCRVIEPLIKHLNDYRSRYFIQLRYDTVQTGRQGKPAIGSVLFIVNGKVKSNEAYEQALNTISGSWDYWRSSWPNPMNTAIILRKLGDDGIPSFNAKIVNACSKRAAKAEKKNQKIETIIEKKWLANLVAKILLEDFKINVYENKN